MSARHPGQAIRNRMLDKGMTQAELSKALRVSDVFVHYLVTGQRDVSPTMAKRIAKVLGGTPMQWLTAQARWRLKSA